MEAAVVEFERGAQAEGSNRAVERLLGHSGAAWRLAVRVLGAEEGAEDVVQQSYLAAAEKNQVVGSRFSVFGATDNGQPTTDNRPLPPGDERAWFLGMVANLAKKHMRSEAHRRRREAAVRRETPASSGPDGEMVSALRRALEALDEKYRLPVALCCEEGLSQREAAAVLNLPA